MIHFAIVGCGHIAAKHREAICGAEGGELIAICDNNPERAAKCGEEWTVPAYTDLQDMLDCQPHIDVVCICTPTGLHAKQALAAIREGKHVVIEKPITLSLQDADQLIAEAGCRGLKLAVVHPNRFRPAMRVLKMAVELGWFGKLSHVNATVRWNRSQAYYDQSAWRGTIAMDGGVILNQAIHSLDLLLWLVGPVEQVKSVSATRCRNIESEDTAVAALQFADGTIGVVEATTAIYGGNLEESIGIFGETGYAIVGGQTANRFRAWRSEALTDAEAAEWINEVERDPEGYSGHRTIIEDMVTAIRDNRDPVVTAWDGRQALKLALDICNYENKLEHSDKEKELSYATFSRQAHELPVGADCPAD